jgi:hypothetical protein
MDLNDSLLLILTKKGYHESQVRVVTMPPPGLEQAGVHTQITIHFPDSSSLSVIQ